MDLNWLHRLLFLFLGLAIAIIIMLAQKYSRKLLCVLIDLSFFTFVGGGIAFFGYSLLNSQFDQGLLLVLLTYFLSFPAFYYLRKYIGED